MNLEVAQLDKSFAGKKAVDSITLSVAPGTIHGLLGSNGAGKTTFMKLLSGIYRPDAGFVIFDGTGIYGNPEIKSRIMFISDHPYFLNGKTLLSMAEFYKAMYPRWSSARFDQLAHHFGLDIHQPLSQLSKGMKRQATFVLAYSSRPRVLLLDEPFDGLDPIIRRQVKDIMMQDIENHGMMVIISSHNLREMEDICDSVSMMHKGKLLFHSNLDEVRGTHFKLQIAFDVLPPESFFKDAGVVHHEIRGRVVTCIVKGDRYDIERKITKYNPLMYDILPLSLEEIFAYEMGERGYAISDIIIE